MAMMMSSHEGQKNRTRRAQLRQLASGFLLTILLTSGAQADYKDAYKDGLEAAKQRNWSSVEAKMKGAIAERPQEAIRLAALFFKNYLPHYYLGLARFELGDCRGALESWETSSSQGAVQKATEEWSTLQSKRKTCQLRLAEVEQAAREAEKAVATAKDLLARVAAIARSPELAASWAAGETSLASRQRAAADEVKQAEVRTQSGSEKLSLGEVREATNLANHAIGELQQILSAAARGRDEVRSVVAARKGALEVKVADAKRALDATAKISPQPASIGPQRAAIETLLRQAASLSDLPDLAEVDALTDQIDKAVAKLRRLGEPPPALLADAVESYLTGDYRGVLAQLESATLRDNRSKGQACLLRAAAGYALYMLGGESDPTLLAAARQAAVEGKAFGGSAPRLSPKLFSPRFISFWQE